MDIATNCNRCGNWLDVWFLEQQFANVVAQFLSIYGPKNDLSVIHKMQQERKRYLDQHALPSNHFRGDICTVLQCQSSGLDPPFWFENSWTCNEHAQYPSPRKCLGKLSAGTTWCKTSQMSRDLWMAPRENENNAYAICLCKIWQTKSIMVYYGIFWSGQIAWCSCTAKKIPFLKQGPAYKKEGPEPKNLISNNWKLLNEKSKADFTVGNIYIKWIERSTKYALPRVKKRYRKKAVFLHRYIFVKGQLFYKNIFCKKTFIL